MGSGGGPWVVVDPVRECDVMDLILEATLGLPELWLKEGRFEGRNPKLFADERKAKLEAFGRLTALRAAAMVRDRLARGEHVDLPLRIQIHGADGELVYEVLIEADGLARRALRRAAGKGG
jgi:hypothetical protein